MDTTAESSVSLETLFSSLRNQPVLFVRPGGNFGDHFIYLGAEVLATRLALTFSTVDYDEQFATHEYPSFKAVYLHGGGGLNRWTSGRALKAFVRAVERYDGPIIQGPQTATDDAEYIQELARILNNIGGKKEVYFFAREEKTYNNLRGALARDARVHLCLDRDTALHATAGDLLSRINHVGKRRYRLDAFREDNERTGLESSFSSDKSHVGLDPAIYAKSFEHWIGIHAASREIRTNRTHSAIAGSILGIKTTIFASSSHKNRSIWQYSLRSRGVAWVGPISENDRSYDQVKASDSDQRPARFTGRLKNILRPAYNVIHLPRLRAIFSEEAGRMRNRLKGVPWR